MYVDVHKAIRRAHPAPKARIQRRDILLKDAAVRDGTLVDLSEEDGDHITRTVSGGNKNESFITSGSPKPTAFFMRRGSAGQKVSVKANFDDMREHLKHLGPSNPASNPKSTRVSAVKIKPGLSQSPEQRRSNSAATETLVEGLEDHVDEHTTLLGPSQQQQDHREYGSQTAKDSNAGSSGGITVKVDTEQTKNGSTNESSPTDSTGSNLGVPRRSRGHARSGSITENVIEAGGVRKVVLRLSSTGPTNPGRPSSARPPSTDLPRDQEQQENDEDENAKKNGDGGK